MQKSKALLLWYRHPTEPCCVLCCKMPSLVTHLSSETCKAIKSHSAQLLRQSVEVVEAPMALFQGRTRVMMSKNDVYFGMNVRGCALGDDVTHTSHVYLAFCETRCFKDNIHILFQMRKWTSYSCSEASNTVRRDPFVFSPCARICKGMILAGNVYLGSCYTLGQTQ